ncbi:MAG: hypothetical protein H6729_15875 [Deltaproteobacteria bacterium]|nr:hypothetical protein [Deltaproteobacteria bacterium]
MLTLSFATLCALALGANASSFPAASPASSTSSAPSDPSDPSGVEAKKEALTTALRAFEAKTQHLDATRRANTELADRIAELKQRRSHKDYSVDAELSRLLRKSVDSEQATTGARNALEEARAEVARTALDVSSAIRREIASLRPHLTSGPAPERREAAARILALRKTRTEIGVIVDRLEHREASNQSAPLVVSADPLDGPSDLLEKAEWVEFTRTKLLKKIAEIKQKAEEAERTRQMEQDFLAFQTDTTHFDERLHAERVVRQSSAPSSAVLVRQGDSTPPETATAGSETTGATDTRTDQGTEGTAGPDSASGAASSDTPSGPYSEAPNLGNVGTSEASSGSQPPPATGTETRGSGSTSGSSAAVSGPAYAPTPIAKDLSADVALGLDPAAIGANTHPRTLARLIEALVQLDSKLAQEAKALRRRAQVLEQSETKNQGQQK